MKEVGWSAIDGLVQHNADTNLMCKEGGVTAGPQRQRQSNVRGSPLSGVLTDERLSSFLPSFCTFPPMTPAGLEPGAADGGAATEDAVPPAAAFCCFLAASSAAFLFFAYARSRNGEMMRKLGQHGGGCRDRHGAGTGVDKNEPSDGQTTKDTIVQCEGRSALSADIARATRTSLRIASLLLCALDLGSKETTTRSNSRTKKPLPPAETPERVGGNIRFPCLRHSFALCCSPNLPRRASALVG